MYIIKQTKNACMFSVLKNLFHKNICLTFSEIKDAVDENGDEDTS